MFHGAFFRHCLLIGNMFLLLLVIFIKLWNLILHPRHTAHCAKCLDFTQVLVYQCSWAADRARGRWVPYLPPLTFVRVVCIHLCIPWEMGIKIGGWGGTCSTFFLTWLLFLQPQKGGWVRVYMHMATAVNLISCMYSTGLIHGKWNLE